MDALKDGDTITLPGVYAVEGWAAWARRLYRREPRPLQTYQIVEPQAIQPVVVVQSRKAYCTITRIGQKQAQREWHSVCGAGEPGSAPGLNGHVRVETGHWVQVREM